MIPFLFEACFVFLVICAAVTDYQKMKIPNWISLALCALFAIYAFSLPMWADVGRHVAVGALVFVAAVACYAFGVFGGGDVKLLGAVALWAGPDRVFEFLAFTGLLGGVLGLVVLAARQSLKMFPAVPDWPNPIWNLARWGRDGTCPYGIPIAIAALLSVPAMFAL